MPAPQLGPAVAESPPSLRNYYLPILVPSYTGEPLAQEKTHSDLPQYRFTELHSTMWREGREKKLKILKKIRLALPEICSKHFRADTHWATGPSP